MTLHTHGIKFSSTAWTKIEVYGNDSIVSIRFPLPSRHFRSHPRQRLHIDYLKAKKYVYCVVNSKQIRSCSRSIVIQTHHSSVIIIITIIAYHCSLFNVYQTVTTCYCAKQQAVHTADGQRWEFYFSPIIYAIPIPISSPKLLLFPWESHGNENSHSHAHL